MPNRHVLHIKHLDRFKDWLRNDGFMIEEPKGDYEILRARKNKKLLIVYDRNNVKEHFTVRDCDFAVVGAFLRDIKKDGEQE